MVMDDGVVCNRSLGCVPQNLRLMGDGVELWVPELEVVGPRKCSCEPQKMKLRATEVEVVGHRVGLWPMDV